MVDLSELYGKLSKIYQLEVGWVFTIWDEQQSMSAFVKAIAGQVEDANLQPFEVLVFCIVSAIIQHLVDDAYLGGEVAATYAAVLVGHLLKRLIVQFNHVFAYTFYVFRFRAQVHEACAQQLI